jgi:hypothetical protein
LSAPDHQFDLFAALMGHVAHDARKPAEELIHRNHAYLHHRVLQIIQHPRLKRHGIGELSPQRIFGEALSEFQQRLLQHRFRENQFADQVEYAVDSFRIHAQQVVGPARYDRRRFSTHRGSGGGLRALVFDSPRGSGVIFLRLVAACRVRVCRRAEGAGQRLGTEGGYFHIPRNRGNVALLADLLARLWRGEGRFHMRQRIGTAFGWVKGEDFAQSRQRELDHLPSGDRHGALRVDVHHHVVNATACVERTADRQLFVFRPADGFGDRFPRFLFCLGHCLRMGEASDVGAQRLDGGKFRSLPVGLEQSGKYIGRTQCDLRHGGGRILHRQHILELVAKFAQFPEAAGSRIPLQRVHGAPQTARRFRVARYFFQAQRFLVELLDQFARALKKQLVEFRHPIVGRSAHTSTSTRWYAVPLLRCTI